MHHQQCLVCGSTKLVSMPRYQKHQLVKCSNCGFVFMSRIPSVQELSDHYAAYPYDKDQYLSPLTIEAFDELIRKFNGYRQTNNILDIGCGQGWLLDRALIQNWNAYGTEYSDVAINKCMAKGIKMVKGTADAYDDDLFDVIIMSEVIEHINNPLEELTRCYRKLRKGGLLYITTPNFNCYLRYYLKENYNVIDYPEHLSYYTRSTLHKVLSKCGFKKLKLSTTGISVSRMNDSKTLVANDHDRNVLIPYHAENADERLRRAMTKNGLMRFAKNSVNSMLNISGLGMTLKAWYVKPD